MRVNLVGPGKLGQCLLLLMADAEGVEIGDVCARTFETACRAVDLANAGRAVGHVYDMGPADLWLLTVQDAQIAHVAAALAARDLPASAAVHCSGFHGSSVLAPLAAKGWRVASVHPNLSFADPVSAARRFPGCFCGVEGDGACAAPLFERLGGRVFPIRSEAKALYHAAAVFSNNFTTVLQAAARDAWAEAGVPDDVAEALHAALLRGTVDNVLDAGARDALTGPAARGDAGVVAAQGRVVAAWKPEAGEAYRLLSAMATRLKRDGTI